MAGFLVLHTHVIYSDLGFDLVLILYRANADRNASCPHPEDHERCLQCRDVKGTAV